MQWQILTPALSGFDSGAVQLPNTAVAMVTVADHSDCLIGDEQNEAASMVAVRQHGFSSGRYCAHMAQELLGLPAASVPRKKRVPIWPGPSVGSITHSHTIAAAVASTTYRGVGIDIENSGRVTEKMHRILFTENEKRCLPKFDFDAATVIFSAKEAGYKAIYPLAETYIGFQAAEVLLNAAEQTFSIRYLGEHTPNKALETGQGYWLEYAGHVLTFFVIP